MTVLQTDHWQKYHDQMVKHLAVLQGSAGAPSGLQSKWGVEWHTKRVKSVIAALKRLLDRHATLAT